MGDGMLVEFASVVDAVRTAVETQAAVAKRYAGLPEDKRIEFRVGINLGDVIIDGDDIHGDGVNVAARLESLAEPGGVCVSDKVYEEVRDRTDFAFEDLGEREVKNIDRPVRVWQWIVDAGLAADVPAKTDEPLSLPDKPSIAVLPFDNMSGDPEQEYFGDGIAEDVITALSRFNSLFVIARNSSFTYKGQAVDIAQVGRELGVRYVVEGSVRKAGNRVRITAQLIDAASGNHLWADRFDRDITDIFELQDEITETVVGAVEQEIGSTERTRATHMHPENLQAWELLQRGLFHVW
jgi:adenylate cyclase